MSTSPAAPPRVLVRTFGADRVVRLRRPVATIGTLALATLALHVRDPHTSGSWGLCPSAVLGFWCPGCGGLRGVNDLTHLRPVDAASSNLLLVLALPVAIVLLARWLLDAWTGRVRPPLRPSVHRTLVVTGLTVLALFTLARNLPFGAWLAP